MNNILIGSKIVLIGNVIFDQIYYISKFPQINKSNEAIDSFSSIGAIGNCLKNLSLIDKNIMVTVNVAIGDDIEGRLIKDYLYAITSNKSDINILPDSSTSKATLFMDINTNEKTSIVDWGACSKADNYKIFKNKWCHILYLERLNGINYNYLIELRNNKCILSADLCSSQFDVESKAELLRNISLLDYVIISDNEANGLFESKGMLDIVLTLGSSVKEYAIIHHRNGSYYSNGNEVVKINIETDDAIDCNIHNVVGAGDAFASSFIYYRLADNDIRSAINMSHQATTNYLQEVNK